jgi:hypothetical protein
VESWRPWLRFVGVQIGLAIVTFLAAFGLHAAGFGWVGSRVFVLATILAGVGAVFAFLFGLIWGVEVLVRLSSKGARRLRRLPSDGRSG